MRVLAEVSAGGVRLWSRNENDVTVSFPELAEAGVLAGREVLLDGEVVAMADGVPTFAALADRMHVGKAARARQLARTNPVTLIVFDVLSLDGRDLTGEPWEVRRAALESLGIGSAHWQVPPVYEDGQMLRAATEQQGLEGVVSKKRSSCYVPGRRTRDWLKFPNRATDSYVVGGWRHETGSSSRLGALLVGTPTAQGLSYRGRIGSGLTGRKAQALQERLVPLRAAGSPFCDEVPRGDATGTVWVRPEVVVELASLGVTAAGRLRQPSFQGVREDLTPADLGA
jgi:bifunctional non-homologous end joining protein LigD